MLLLVVALIALFIQSSSAFVATSNNCNLQCTSVSYSSLLAAPVAIPGTETETEEKREVYIPGEEKAPSTETGGAGNKGPVSLALLSMQN